MKQNGRRRRSPRPASPRQATSGSAHSHHTQTLQKALYPVIHGRWDYLKSPSEEKERIQRVAREKGRLEFRGKQLLIFPDYSADLARRRAAFSEVKATLRKQEGVRYGLLYPARLRVSVDGETKVFDTPKSVKDFIDFRFGKDE
ncbi:hypothetical protein WMY93_002940 [Mugilogobius chulae]|uniref:Uncharacterized protein n=1 Tax=Mugilogobius chulae TaxID=88201 RepID=A0AAW0Q649_9GOBI